MESIKLTIFNDKLKLRDYKEENLDKILHTSFMFWLANLLALKEDKEQNLINSINEIKFHFLGFALSDVKKAFEMYARGQLSINPISNHIDPILVGQISLDWKSLNAKKTKKIMIPEKSEQEIKKLNNQIVLNFLNHYEEHFVVDEERFYVYDILDKMGLMNKDMNYKKSVQKDAVYLLEQENLNKKAGSRYEKKEIKNELKIIKMGLGGIVKRKCKILALEDYLRNLYRDKEKVTEFKNMFL